MKIGDLVKCKYCEKDIVFEIIDIKDDLYKIRGVEYRILTEKEKNSLEIINKRDIVDYAKDSRNTVVDKVKEILKEREDEIDIKKNGGLVLHVDSDGKYLELCMQFYENLKVDVKGVYVEEDKQPGEIVDLLKKYNPDILVITGHDSYNNKDKEDLENYKNSKYFIETVKKARNYNPSKDSLIIIAGACESNYEELIKAGANFGSSPNRVVIHALDPALIAEQIAHTDVSEYIDVRRTIVRTVTGFGGMGGIESKGTLRTRYPS